MAEAVPVFTTTPPRVRRIELDRPWTWLAAGWRDLCRAPRVSLVYGVLFALAGYAITFGLWWADLIYLILPMVCGFLIIGPLLAVGLYEVSRRLETGEPVSLGAAVMAWQRNGSQIGLMGVVLLLLLFVWIRLAALLFMLFFGLEPPAFSGLFAATFLNPDALPFLIVGTAIGAALAVLAFARPRFRFCWTNPSRTCSRRSPPASRRSRRTPGPCCSGRCLWWASPAPASSRCILV